MLVGFSSRQLEHFLGQNMAAGSAFLLLWCVPARTDDAQAEGLTLIM